MSETSERVALLLAENDRLRVRCRQIDDEAFDYAEQIEQQKAEIDRLRDDLHTQEPWVEWANREMDALRLANKEAIDHYADARAEIERLRAAIARVRALHNNNVRHYECSECCFEYPCDTILALDDDE